ncbi:hypothetical protein [Mesonia aestuariivivens]|uniref:Uncharacterized protein n=1 Tax=Mesonia aestuariivivens TaxID=2796128 RepID=A0ABS6W4Q9_9FLAO|nr:hypothetical protein [Mesonia aestuariivivens]MBW2962856.1 hypothetical protein [Mesonia aestuariivivens]
MEDFSIQNSSNHIKPGKWALYIFVSGLPLIGLIMLLVWGFSSDTNKTRQNWAKGMLLLYVIMIILTIAFFSLFGLAALGLGSMEGNY